MNRFQGRSYILPEASCKSEPKLGFRISWSALAFLLLLAISAAAPRLHAQTTATLTGTVQDPSGAMIPGAGVTLINEATQDTRVSKSNDSGLFSFPSLVPGSYSIKGTIGLRARF